MSLPRVVSLVLVLVLPCVSGQAQRIVAGKIRPALLVVDVQNAFIPFMAEADQKSAPEAINGAIHLFRTFHQPVIRVYHADPGRGPAPGTKAFEFPESFQVKAEDPKVIKNFGNAFIKTDLDKLLKEKGINTVFVCGLSATGCGLATYRGAEDLGYTVFMIKSGLMSPKASQTEAIEDICDSVSWKGLVAILSGTLPDPDKLKPLGYGDAARVVEEVRRLRGAHPQDPDFTEAGLNDWAYRVLGLGFKEAAIGLFRLNGEFHPDSANCQDSLAEALESAGSPAKALEGYRRAVQLRDRFPEANKGYAPNRQATLDKIQRLEKGASAPK